MPNHSASFDVIVIGGGVIGLAAAWRLAQRDLRVVVLDRGEPGGGTTHVAAGMVAPIAEADLREEPLVRLGVRSAAAYPQFVSDLAEASGVDPGYNECGTLIVARDRDEAEALTRVQEVRNQLGLPVTRLLAGQARRLEPALAPTLRLALDVPTDHVVDPRKLTAALAKAVVNAGGMIQTSAEVRAVSTRGSTVDGVELSAGGRIAARHVVIAAGPWSDGIEGLPDDARVPLRPVKGQILHLHDPSGPGLLTRVLRFPPGYIAPRGDGRYVLGATMEERGLDTSVTAGAVFELLRDASELVPGISELVVDELSAGLRPGTPDNAPAIGPGALRGLHWATGHYRHGVLLAPVTAELVADQIVNGTAPAAALDPARFARGTESVGPPAAAGTRG